MLLHISLASPITLYARPRRVEIARSASGTISGAERRLTPRSSRRGSVSWRGHFRASRAARQPHFAPAASRVSRGGRRASVRPARGGPRRLSVGVRQTEQDAHASLYSASCLIRLKQAKWLSLWHLHLHLNRTISATCCEHHVR